MSVQKKCIEKKIPCKLSSITTERMTNLAMMLSKDNPYTGVINYHLQKFLDGMIMRLKETYSSQLAEDKIFKPVYLFNVIPISAILCDLKTTPLVHTLSRELSRQRVMIMSITFSNLMSKYNDYQKNVGPYCLMPLFVVLLDTEETMCEFANTTKGIKPISFPIWLIVFLQHLGNPLKDYCTHPANNIFNVDISTQMLVLCYNRPILVEWYAIGDNYTRTFDLATWSPDRGLILRTQENLYARRSDMFGDVVRVTIVNNSPLVSLKNGTMDGFFGLLLIELSKVMNFTIKILDFRLGKDKLNTNEQKEFPIESSMRLAFFSIYVSSVIILSTYFASLISYLALNTAQLPFSTLEGYVEDGTYKLLVLQNSAEYDIPLYSKDPLLLKIYESRENKYYLPFNLSEGFKKICERMDLVFLTTELFENYMSIYIQCQLVYINTGRMEDIAITLKKGSPYTSFINYHLRRFQLNGVINKLRNKNPLKMPMKGLIGNFTVDITDVTPILTIVAGSTVLSLFILIIEKVYYSFKSLNSKNNESITKFTYNLNVRNKLRKELRLQEFYKKSIDY
ncbi:PREDICTED: LOW QUALITY PROTEIN: uncharacterized protein LOC108766847 [Trachymyrmex cornetzi]|uniref:LOW QUALITY PROTEIN: uncharacterized protein LOC108766847 n=1 Tax=Trachymyrmex cornetzi TaxID=471704 RepID=UPI00084F6A53|nr:PREDICTED: LOW QUALITY PROTEIN: uncharacterized protein LOC108766847 [Trachymyrmex cornetzi]